MTDTVRLDWGVSRRPLAKPYELSFATLTTFESVWVAARRSDGAVGLGEAVALPGYGWETAEDARRVVGELVERLDGKPAAEIAAACADASEAAPFAASAVVSAVELGDWLGRAAEGRPVPVNMALAATRTPETLEGAIAPALGAGRRYFKCKVGKDIEADIATAAWLLPRLAAAGARCVFDANQAHSLDEARAFARAVAPHGQDSLAWYEQPCDRRDWDAHAALIGGTETAVVLDECIYTAADIDRARRIGAAGVKLKLFKHPGLAETDRLARYAKDLGLIVVMGNGVATDIGNFAEYLLLAAGAGVYTHPAESTGFAKLVEPFALAGLAVTADGRFRIDDPAGADWGGRVRAAVERLSAE